MKLFELSPKDDKKVNKWIKMKHSKCLKEYVGAIGGHIEYWVIYTGLGPLYGTRCLVCKENDLNLTDFSEW